MRLRNIATIIFISTQFWGCGGFSQEENIVKNYALLSLENLNDTRLVKKASNGSIPEMVIEPYVFAVGWNEEFIIVKRNPQGLKQKKVEWYIIELDSDMLRGPYTEAEFNSTRERLGGFVNIHFQIDTEKMGEGLK